MPSRLKGDYSQTTFTQIGGPDARKFLGEAIFTSQILFKVQTYKTTSPVAQGRFQDLSEGSVLIF